MESPKNAGLDSRARSSLLRLLALVAVLEIFLSRWTRRLARRRIPVTEI